MSRLYFVVCIDCLEESDTVTKNSPEYGIWTPDDLLLFLFAHENHRLRFVDEHSDVHDNIVQKYEGHVRMKHREQA